MLYLRGKTIADRVLHPFQSGGTRIKVEKDGRSKRPRNSKRVTLRSHRNG